MFNYSLRELVCSLCATAMVFVFVCVRFGQMLSTLAVHYYYGHWGIRYFVLNTLFYLLHGIGFVIDQF